MWCWEQEAYSRSILGRGLGAGEVRDKGNGGLERMARAKRPYGALQILNFSPRAVGKPPEGF